MATVAASQQQQKPALSSSHPFTCNTCQVAFRSSDSQRTHYHTDWHQYNLKRKVASLPPLSSETFAEKVLHAQTSTRLERERATFEKLCKACDKTYFSENAYANHVGSQKHRQNVATQQMNAIRAGGSGRSVVSVGGQKPKEDKDETESVVSSSFSLGEPVSEEKDVDSLPKKVEALNISTATTDSPPSPAESPLPPAENEPTSLSLEACLFCSYVSPTLTLNVCHMTKAHGLFIPEANYLVDLEGLIKYLGKKLLLGNQCLYCNKTKGGLEGIRTHMRDKGHTMLGFDTEEQQIELGQYYDFRGSYSDAGEESESSDEATGKKLRPRGPNEDEGWEAAGDNVDGEGWETDSSASSLDSADLTSVRVDRTRDRHEDGEKRRHRMSDGFHSHAHHHGVLYHDEHELHLPSGRSVGHRSLARYYRQNLREHPLQDKSVRRIADIRYPHGVDMSDDEDVDMEDGGVEVEEEGEEGGRQLNRRERREMAALSRRHEQGLIGVSAAKRREITKMGKKSRDEELRGRRRQEWVVDKKGNSQKHYRDPLLQ